MIQEDRARVVHGQVYYQNRWMPAEKKAELEANRLGIIQKGLVQYNGEWIPIDDKVAMLSKNKNVDKATRKVVVNKTVNRQVYNVNVHNDNRNIQHTTNEHRHVHVDQELLQGYSQQHTGSRISQNMTPFLGEDAGKPAIEDKKQKNLPPPVSDEDWKDYDIWQDCPDEPA